METTDNAFENESHFESAKKRKYKDRLNKYKDEDPDIQVEIDKGNQVKILYDSRDRI